MELWDEGDCGIMWFWMYDTQVQGSEVTILLTLHSRFSADFIGFPEVESLWHLQVMGFYEGFLEICGQNWSITMLLGC